MNISATLTQGTLLLIFATKASREVITEFPASINTVVYIFLSTL